MMFALGFLSGFITACALWFAWAIGYRQGPEAQSWPEDTVDLPEYAPGSRNYVMTYVCQHGDDMDNCPVCRH